jgi:hypothetical protein
MKSAFVERDRPRQTGLHGEMLHPCPGVQIHPGFEAQRVARTQTRGHDAGADQLVPQIDRLRAGTMIS